MAIALYGRCAAGRELHGTTKTTTVTDFFGSHLLPLEIAPARRVGG
jgi:hypothetical protein